MDRLIIIYIVSYGLQCIICFFFLFVSFLVLVICILCAKSSLHCLFWRWTGCFNVIIEICIFTLLLLETFEIRFTGVWVVHFRRWRGWRAHGTLRAQGNSSRTGACISYYSEGRSMVTQRGPVVKRFPFVSDDLTSERDLLWTSHKERYASQLVPYSALAERVEICPRKACSIVFSHVHQAPKLPPNASWGRREAWTRR